MCCVSKGSPEPHHGRGEKRGPWNPTPVPLACPSRPGSRRLGLHLHGRVRAAGRAPPPAQGPCLHLRSTCRVRCEDEKKPAKPSLQLHLLAVSWQAPCPCPRDSLPRDRLPRVLVSVVARQAKARSSSSRSEVRTLLLDIDHDKSGEVDFEEFRAWARPAHQSFRAEACASFALLRPSVVHGPPYRCGKSA